VAVSSLDFPSRDGGELSLLINGKFVLSARPHDNIQQGHIGLSDPQRTWMNIALTDLVDVEMFDQFSQSYLGSMDIEIGFASKNKKVEAPYDQDELAKIVTQV
jgi:vesicle-fusing ATPase